MQTQVLLYRTLSQPQDLPAFPVWGQKKHDRSPNFSIQSHWIHTTKLLLTINSSSLAILRVDILGKSLNVRFIIKTRQNGPDLISTSHGEALQLQRSTKFILQSDLEGYQIQMAPKRGSTAKLSEVNNRFCQKRLNQWMEKSLPINVSKEFPEICPRDRNNRIVFFEYFEKKFFE